jgi:hypothetical protein
VNIERLIFGNASATKFIPSEDLADSIGLKLLHFKNYFEIVAIIAKLKDRKRTQ